MEKLETWIYIQWFWLQMVMASPGTHLVKNIESQLKKTLVQVWNRKCLGPYVTRQLIWLDRLQNSVLLQYTKKSIWTFYFRAKQRLKQIPSLNDSHNKWNRINEQNISTNTHVQIFYWFLRPSECMPRILLFCITGDFYASGMQQGSIFAVLWLSQMTTIWYGPLR